MRTYVLIVAHAGAEDLTDQLAGTPVEFVGKSGRVRVAIVSAKAEDTYKLVVGGTEVVPAGCRANKLAAADSQSVSVGDFVHDVAGLKPGTKMSLEISAAAASESMVAVAS